MPDDPTYATIKEVRFVTSTGKLFYADIPSSAATVTVACTYGTSTAKATDIYDSTIIKAEAVYAADAEATDVRVTKADYTSSNAFGSSTLEVTIPAITGVTTQSKVTIASSNYILLPKRAELKHSPRWVDELKVYTGKITPASGGAKLYIDDDIAAVFNFECPLGYGVYDFTNKKMKIYADGSEVTSGNATDYRITYLAKESC